MRSDLDSYVQGFCTGALAITVPAMIALSQPWWAVAIVGVFLALCIAGELLSR
jgi:hypothetical protein